VPLNGYGVPVRVPPAEQIVDILAFVDSAVEGGTLAGSGPGGSASGRLGALINMVEAAGTMVADSQIAEACQQLQDALRRTDGAPRPPDFVTGPNATDLAARIQTLGEDLGCP
jgi:hypothetical protein